MENVYYTALYKVAKRLDFLLDFCIVKNREKNLVVWPRLYICRPIFSYYRVLLLMLLCDNFIYSQLLQRYFSKLMPIQANYLHYKIYTENNKLLIVLNTLSLMILERLTSQVPYGLALASALQMFQAVSISFIQTGMCDFMNVSMYCFFLL